MIAGMRQLRLPVNEVHVHVYDARPIIIYMPKADDPANTKQLYTFYTTTLVQWYTNVKIKIKLFVFQTAQCEEYQECTLQSVICNEPSCFKIAKCVGKFISPPTTCGHAE